MSPLDISPTSDQAYRRFRAFYNNGCSPHPGGIISPAHPSSSVEHLVQCHSGCTPRQIISPGSQAPLPLTNHNVTDCPGSQVPQPLPDHNVTKCPPSKEVGPVSSVSEQMASVNAPCTCLPTNDQGTLPPDKRVRLQ